MKKKANGLDRRAFLSVTAGAAAAATTAPAAAATGINPPVTTPPSKLPPSTLTELAGIEIAQAATNKAQLNDDWDPAYHVKNPGSDFAAATSNDGPKRCDRRVDQRLRPACAESISRRARHAGGESALALARREKALQ